MFPIKYIDNNLVWNKDNEVFAYYELIPYNYSFLSAEQKFIVHDSFRQLIAQSREGKIHALQIATESSIRSMQEQSKKLVTGAAHCNSSIHALGHSVHLLRLRIWHRGQKGVGQ